MPYHSVYPNSNFQGPEGNLPFNSKLQLNKQLFVVFFFFFFSFPGFGKSYIVKFNSPLISAQEFL